jgi:hypothetical protein
VTVERERVLMGTRCSLVLQGEDAAALEDAATAAFETIARLEDVASNWSGTSELARFNAEAAKGTTVVASPDLFDVLARATAWSVRTHGAFDATVEPLTRVYDLRGKGRIPAESERARAAALVRGAAVTLDAQARTVTLPVQGMAFDLGGIGKGWAIDRAVETLKARGVTSALLNFGGQVYALGAPVGADGWTVEIAVAERSVEGRGHAPAQGPFAVDQRRVRARRRRGRHDAEPHPRSRDGSPGGSVGLGVGDCRERDRRGLRLDRAVRAGRGEGPGVGKGPDRPRGRLPHARRPGRQRREDRRATSTGRATVALFAAAPATALAQNDATRPRARRSWRAASTCSPARWTI